jgi:hypothetical protein
MDERDRGTNEGRELPDYELRRPEPLEVDRPARTMTIGPWVVIAVVVIAAAAAFFWFRSRGAPAQQPPEQAAARQQPQDKALPPLGGAPAAVNVPPLDESDAVVRELVRQLSTHPTVAAWLATDGLIRNFTVVTANIAEGATPERHLRRLRPSEPFVVQRRGNQFEIDPAGYRRYDKVAAAAASIDPAGAARLYATLKPRIEEASRDLGNPDTPVDRVVEQAIVRLLRTPIVEAPPRVVPASKGVGYAFANPDLEGLSAAQKQLVRMGPENTRTIQRSLRAIAAALGIPASHLPEPMVIPSP